MFCFLEQSTITSRYIYSFLFLTFVQIHLFIYLMTSVAAVDVMKYIVHRMLEPSSVCGAHSAPTEIKYNIQLSFLIFYYFQVSD